MYWINGQPETQLLVSDRAVQFGDGFFTTAYVSAGKIQLLQQHKQRLQHAAQQLLITDVDWDALFQEMYQVAQSVEGDAVLKVIVSRGTGGRGYSPAGCSSATRIIILQPYPQHYITWRQQGVLLTESPVKLSKNALFAGIKHLNRLEQILIRAHLEQTNADEALVLDTDGMLVECCAANLFWRKGRCVFTPNLEQSGVAGVMRRHISQWLMQTDYSLEYVSQPLDTLATADEVFICNALMPILPVNQAATWEYHSRELYDLLSYSLLINTD